MTTFTSATAPDPMVSGGQILPGTPLFRLRAAAEMANGRAFDHHAGDLFDVANTVPEPRPKAVADLLLKASMSSSPGDLVRVTGPEVKALIEAAVRAAA